MRFVTASLVILFLIPVVFAFSVPLKTTTIKAEEEPVYYNLRTVCADYCQDSIYYYDGSINQLTERCMYHQKVCDYGCEDGVCKVPSTDRYATISRTDLIEIDSVTIDTSIIEKKDTDFTTLPFDIKKGPLMYVANKEVIVIDSSNYEELARISLTYDAKKAALSLDDSVLYVISNGRIPAPSWMGTIDTSTLTLINTTTNEVIREIDLGSFVVALHLGVAPDGRVYVSWEHFYTYGGSYPGYSVFDFKKDLVWTHSFTNQYQQFTTTDFAFNNDGSMAYFTMYGPSTAIYEIDWNKNQAFINRFYGGFDRPRTIVASTNTERLYFNGFSKNYIGYMRAADKNFQAWVEDYMVYDIAYSPSRHALYTIGDKDGVAVLDKLTGLRGILVAYPAELEDFSVPDASSYYTDKKRVLMSLPKDTVAYNLLLSPDEKRLYIMNAKKEEREYFRVHYGGDRILVYDAETMQHLKTINMNMKSATANIALTKNKVTWKPSPEKDIRVEVDVIKTEIHLEELKKKPTVESISPANGTTGAYVNNPVMVHFSEEINPGTVDDDSFIILNSHYSAIPGERVVHKNVITFFPEKHYTSESKVFVTVTDRIRSVDDAPAKWEHYQFTTGNEAFNPEIIKEASNAVKAENVVLVEQLQVAESFSGNNKVNVAKQLEVTDDEEETESGTGQDQPDKDSQVEDTPESEQQENSSLFSRVTGFFKKLFGK